MHGDDRLPLLPQLTEQLEDDLLGGGIHAGHRLIHEVDFGLLGESPGQKHPLLLPAGELADLPPLELREAHFLQALPGPFPLAMPRPPKPAQPAVRPHQHHVQHADRKIPIHALTLRHIADLLPLRGDRLPQDPHGAAGHGQQTQHGFDQRALPRSIGPHDRRQLRLLHDEVHIPQHRLALVGDGDVVDVEDGGHAAWGRLPACPEFIRAGWKPTPPFYLSALTIVLTLCLTIPSYVPSSVPSLPIASE